MGSVSDSRFACLGADEAIDCARACVNRLPEGNSRQGRGGGGIDSAVSLLIGPFVCCCREISSSLTCASTESGVGEKVVDMAMALVMGERELS